MELLTLVGTTLCVSHGNWRMFKGEKEAKRHINQKKPKIGVHFPDPKHPLSLFRVKYKPLKLNKHPHNMSLGGGNTVACFPLKLENVSREKKMFEPLLVGIC
jgi:hypothetical protein